MRNPIDFVRRHTMNALQQSGPAVAHDDNSFREFQDFVHYQFLRKARLLQNGMQCRHDRHAKVAEQCQHMASRLPTKDAVLVLQANDFNVIDVQEVGGAEVFRHLGLFDLKTNGRRIRVMLSAIIHSDHKAVEIREFAGDRLAQIRCECSDSALSRHMIAKQGYTANAGGFRES